MNTQTSRSSFRFALLTSLAGLSLAMQAMADSPDAIRTVTVKYADLNISTIEGATALYQRLKGAARRVCSNADTAPFAAFAYRGCYVKALNDAVAKVNNPMLTALNQGTHTPVTATAMVRR
jgi:UrcA family protein